jgi:hypothetical protein
MAKTVFANGSDVLPAFMNSIMAHVHDGTDADGHAPKVNLYSHTEDSVGTFGIQIGSPDLTGTVTGTVSWIKHGRLVLLQFPTVYGTSNNNGLNIWPQSPASTFPSQISIALNVLVPCILFDDGNEVPGRMNLHSALLTCYCLPAAADGVKLALGANFKTSGNKGILGQFISYMATA